MSNQMDSRNIKVLQFLEAYEKQETLWNPALDSYKNKAARDTAYSKIIRDLNVPSLTIQDVKLKVKSIRTTYTKELRLLTKYKRQGKEYNPKLFWFNRANSFLKKVSLSRDKKNNLSPKDERSTPTKECGVNYIGMEPQDIQIPNLEDPGGQNSTSTFDYKNLQNSQIITQLEENIVDADDEEVLSRKDSRTYEDSQGYQTSSNGAGAACPQISDTTTSTSVQVLEACPLKTPASDEFDLFCRSVAAQLRSITDSYSRSVAKLKIQQILFEAETGHYRNNPCITIPVTQHLNSI